MKSRYVLPRPNRADGTAVPAACAGVLVMLAGLQFALIGNAPLPEASVIGGGVRVDMPQIAGQALPEGLAGTSIFSPERTQAATSAATAAPLGGYSIAGTVRVGRRTLAVVQAPTGAILRQPVGAMIAGWRVRALGPDGALLQRGSERMTVAYGAAATAPASETTETEEQ